MRGIEFEVVWFDQDVIEYKVSCSNGLFCGTAKMYASHGDLSKIGDTLSGFPAHAKDSRSVEAGTFEPHTAGGGIHMNFTCVDSIGHAVVQVTLRADGHEAVGKAGSVSLYVPIEAGTVDSFVMQARSIEASKGSKAHLRMADHHFGSGATI